jgi:hypothetical protein
MENDEEEQQEQQEEEEAQEEQEQEEEDGEEETTEEEAKSDDGESDKFVSGVKESPELVEEDMREQYEAGLSQSDRDALMAVGSSAQRRRGIGS